MFDRAPTLQSHCRWNPQRIVCLTLAVVALQASVAIASPIESIRATSDAIVLTIDSQILPDTTLSLHGVPIHAQLSPASPGVELWTGTPAREISLPRFHNGDDLLYHRFSLSSNGNSIQAAAFVTDVSALPGPTASLPQPTSPKGLQCIVDIDDAIALGVKHSAINVSLAQLHDGSGRSSLRIVVDEKPVHLHESTVAHLDNTIRRMTNAGMRVNLILLNHLPSPDRPAGPLVDPRTDRTTPQRIGGFHLDTPESARIYRGLIEFLAERYSKPKAPHGTVAGYIIGNEVQSHFDWYNLGEIAPADLVANYARALRVADLAVRQHHPDARVFVSMDHNWNRQHRPNPRQSLPGKQFLDQLNEHISPEGNFPWGLAFHPYAENLGNPRTWQDTTALLACDSPRITFKNLEVLTTYLQQLHYLFAGAPRRLIFSEQGFHCLDSPEGERLQAAAYAFAYQRVLRIPGIESFIYHRHVDHAHEGGLRLGLRANQPGTVTTPGEPRQIFDIFRQIDADTPADPAQFALENIGISSWDEVSPKPIQQFPHKAP